MSVLTNNTRFLWDSMSQRASLPAVVVLPAPCRPANNTTTGGCARNSKRAALAAHERDQLLVQDADEGLAGREAGGDLGAERLLLHALDEGLDHRQRDVGLEQRHAHFAQGLADVFFGDAAAAAQRVDGAGKPRRQVLEKCHRGADYRSPMLWGICKTHPR